MQKVYKGKPVTILRAAKEGDPGYAPQVKPPSTEQSLVRLQTGDNIAVLNSDLTEQPEMVPVMEPAKPPKPEAGSIKPSPLDRPQPH